jgi:hypothetical protein
MMYIKKKTKKLVLYLIIFIKKIIMLQMDLMKTILLLKIQIYMMKIKKNLKFILKIKIIAQIK